MRHDVTKHLAGFLAGPVRIGEPRGNGDAGQHKGKNGQDAVESNGRRPVEAAIDHEVPTGAPDDLHPFRSVVAEGLPKAVERIKSHEKRGKLCLTYIRERSCAAARPLALSR